MDDDKQSETPPESTNTPEPTEVTTDSSEEQVPSDNAGDVIAPGSEPKKAPDFTPPKKTRNKKKIIVWLLVIILLLGVGAAAYWYFTKKSPAPATSTSQTDNNPAKQAEVTKTYVPENVSYAYKAKSTDPFSVYYRPAIGGKRVDVSTLRSTDNISWSDAVGVNVAYVIDNKIYVSTDSGAKFSLIYTGTAGSTITSVKFSNDGSKIAFGYLELAGGKNIVKSGDLQGKSFSDLFTSTKAGVFIVGWNAGKNKIVYREGCYNCDGPAGLPVLRDLKTDKVTSVVTGIKDSELGDVNVSDDLSTLVYVRSTENAAAPATIGTFTGAPYVFNSVDLTTNKATEIATVGTKGEKNGNGTYKTRSANVGFLAGTNTPYYSADNQLYTVKDGKASLTYQAAKNILMVVYVSDKTVIAGAGAETSDYTLDNYDITTKKVVNIFSGDNNTIIFGVTTK